MSKFKFVLILVSITNQAIKATTQENVMKKFLNLLSPATPTFTVEETIEWNRMISEAVKAQYESFSDNENLNWGLMVDEVRYEQVGIPSTLAQAYAEMGMGWKEEADRQIAEWDGSNNGFDNNEECPCMGSNDHCHRCSTWDVPLVCKGCGYVEKVEGMDDFCPTCQVDGTEFTLRGGYDKSPDYIHYLENKLSDKVDAACKGSLSDTIDANCKGDWDDNDIPF